MASEDDVPIRKTDVVSFGNDFITRGKDSKGANMPIKIAQPFGCGAWFVAKNQIVGGSHVLLGRRGDFKAIPFWHGEIP